MSFVSCDASLLLPPEPPISYPVGSIGYIYKPTINNTPVASGATIQPITAYTLSKGVWLVSGAIFIDAVTGGQTVNGGTDVFKDGISEYRVQNPVSGQDGLSVIINAVIQSNGSNVITIPMTYNTSGGSNYKVNSADSNIKITRIA